MNKHPVILFFLFIFFQNYYSYQKPQELKQKYTESIKLFTESLSSGSLIMDSKTAEETIAINTTANMLNDVAFGDGKKMILSEFNNNAWMDKLVNIFLTYLPDFSFAVNHKQVYGGANINNFIISHNISREGDFIKDNTTSVLIQSSPIQINKKLECNLVGGVSITQHQFEKNHSFQQYRFIIKSKASFFKIIDNSSLSINYYQVLKEGKIINLRFFCFFLGVFNFIFNISYKTIEGKQYFILSVGGSNIFNILYFNLHFVIDINDLSNNGGIKNIIRNTMPQIKYLLIFASPNLKNVEQMTSNFIANDLFHLVSIEAEETNVLTKAFNEAIEKGDADAISSLIKSMEKKDNKNNSKNTFIIPDAEYMDNQGKSILQFLNFIINFDNKIDENPKIVGNINNIQNAYLTYLSCIGHVKQKNLEQLEYGDFESVIGQFNYLNEKSLILKEEIKNQIKLKTLFPYIDTVFNMLDNNIIDLFNSVIEKAKAFINIPSNNTKPEHKKLEEILNLSLNSFKSQQQSSKSPIQTKKKKVISQFDTQEFLDIYENNKTEFFNFRTKIYDNMQLFFYLSNLIFENSISDNNKHRLMEKFKGDLFITSNKDKIDKINGLLVDLTGKFEKNNVINHWKQALQTIINKCTTGKVAPNFVVFLEQFYNIEKNNSVENINDFANTFNQINTGIMDSFAEDKITDIMIYIYDIIQEFFKLRSTTLTPEITKTYKLDQLNTNIFYTNTKDKIFQNSLNTFFFYMIQDDFSQNNIQKKFAFINGNAGDFLNFLDEFSLKRAKDFQQNIAFPRFVINDLALENGITSDAILKIEENLKKFIEEYLDGEIYEGFSKYKFDFTQLNTNIFKLTDDHKIIRNQYSLLIQLNNFLYHYRPMLNTMSSEFYKSSTMTALENLLNLLHTRFRVNLLNEYWKEKTKLTTEKSNEVFYLTVLKELMARANVIKGEHNLDNWNLAVKTVKNKDQNAITALKNGLINDIINGTSNEIIDITNNLKLSTIETEAKKNFKMDNDYFKYEFDNQAQRDLNKKQATYNSVNTLLSKIADSAYDFFNDMTDKEYLSFDFNSQNSISLSIKNYVNDHIIKNSTLQPLLQESQSYKDAIQNLEDECNRKFTSYTIKKTEADINAVFAQENTIINDIATALDAFLTVSDNNSGSLSSFSNAGLNMFINQQTIKTIVENIKKTYIEPLNSNNTSYQKQINACITAFNSMEQVYKNLSDFLNTKTSFADFFTDITIDYETWNRDLETQQTAYNTAIGKIKTLDPQLKSEQIKLDSLETDLKKQQDNLKIITELIVQLQQQKKDTQDKINQNNNAIKTKTDEENLLDRSKQLIQIKTIKDQIDSLTTNNVELNIEIKNIDIELNTKDVEKTAQETKIKDPKDTTITNQRKQINGIENKKTTENTNRDKAASEFQKIQQKTIQTQLTELKKHDTDLQQLITSLTPLNFYKYISSDLTKLQNEIVNNITKVQNYIQVNIDKDLKLLEKKKQEIKVKTTVKKVNATFIKHLKDDFAEWEKSFISAAAGGAAGGAGAGGAGAGGIAKALSEQSLPTGVNLNNLLLGFNDKYEDIYDQKTTTHSLWAKTSSKDLEGINKTLTSSTDIKAMIDAIKTNLSDKLVKLKNQQQDTQQNFKDKNNLLEQIKTSYLNNSFDINRDNFNKLTKNSRTELTVWLNKIQQSLKEFSQELIIINMFNQSEDIDVYINNNPTILTPQQNKEMFFLRTMPDKFNDTKTLVENSIQYQDKAIHFDTNILIAKPAKTQQNTSAPNNLKISILDVVKDKEDYKTLDNFGVFNKKWSELDAIYEERRFFDVLNNPMDVKQIFFKPSQCFTSQSDSLRAVLKNKIEPFFFIDEETKLPKGEEDFLRQCEIYHDEFTDLPSTKDYFDTILEQLEKINTDQKANPYTMDFQLQIFNFINGLKIKHSYFIANNTNDIKNLLLSSNIADQTNNNSSLSDFVKIGKYVKNGLIDACGNLVQRKITYWAPYYKAGLQKLEFETATSTVIDLLGLIFVKLQDTNFVNEFVEDNEMLILKNSEGFYYFNYDYQNSVANDSPNQSGKNTTETFMQDIFDKLTKSGNLSSMTDSFLGNMIKQISPFLKKFLQNVKDNPDLIHNLINLIISINCSNSAENSNINSIISQIYNNKSMEEFFAFIDPDSTESFEKESEFSSIWQQIYNIKQVFVEDTYSLETILENLQNQQTSLITTPNKKLGIFQFVNFYIGYINNLLYFVNDMKEKYNNESNFAGFNKYTEIHENILKIKKNFFDAMKQEINNLKKQSKNYKNFKNIFKKSNKQLNSIFDKVFNEKEIAENKIYIKIKSLGDTFLINTQIENYFNPEYFSNYLKNYKVVFYRNILNNIMIFSRFTHEKYPSFKNPINMKSIYNVFQALQETFENTIVETKVVYLKNNPLDYNFSFKGRDDLDQKNQADQQEEQKKYKMFFWQNKKHDDIIKYNTAIMTLGEPPIIGGVSGINITANFNQMFESFEKKSQIGNGNTLSLLLRPQSKKKYDDEAKPMLEKIFQQKTNISVNGKLLSGLELIYTDKGTININVLFQILFNFIKDLADVQSYNEEENFFEKIKKVKNDPKGTLLSMKKYIANKLMEDPTIDALSQFIDDESNSILNFLSVLNLFLDNEKKYENPLQLFLKLLNGPKKAQQLLENNLVNIQNIGITILNSKFSIDQFLYLSFIEIIGLIQINLDKRDERVQKNLILLYGSNKKTTKEYFKDWKTFNGKLLNLSRLNLDANQYDNAKSEANTIIE